MFKRTLIGAAVAAAAISGSANAAIQLAGDAVQLYGQAAISYQYWSADHADKENTVVAEVESRFGLRGTVEFEDFGPDLVWQMESGNAANGGGNDKGQGALGGRDTFIGFAFDGLGSIKYGRQLVAAYNYVDWPHTNPGLGNVFDWHNAIGAGYTDRVNNNLRFDSETFGGFNFQATISGMDKTTDAMVASVAGSYTVDGLSVHAGHYTQDEYGDNKGDISYTILGGSFSTGPMTFTAGYKMMENGNYQAKDASDQATGPYMSNDQNAMSVTAAYNHDGAWLYKVGYAQTFESDKGSDDESTAITARVMRMLPSAVIYVDVRNYDMNKAYFKKSDGGDDKYHDDLNDGTRIMLGTEYYF
ncbi:porin [Vibrio albus]|uniref:Porin n=1 Tax=Vibrio albus TaxID=2200953 RepID=A0A2U3BCB4_9VIBR|nr:porin [Vibrio albus]PWI34417.1 porin [Vibrio albus]